MKFYKEPINYNTNKSDFENLSNFHCDSSNICSTTYKNFALNMNNIDFTEISDCNDYDIDAPDFKDNDNNYDTSDVEFRKNV